MHNNVSFQKMQSFFFFGLIFILGIVMLAIFRPFVYPIFWAAIIAVLFYPVYAWIEKKVKKAGLSAALSVLLVIFVIFLPLGFLGTLLVQESADMYESIVAGNFFGKVEQVTAQIEGSRLAPFVENAQQEWTEQAANIAQSVSVSIVKSITSITQNVVVFLGMFLAMLYTLYFFFKDGKRILAYMMHLSPLGDKYEAMLYNKFSSTARATLKSTFIIGGVQGALGGLLFAFTGIEGALVWAAIMTILSIIPAIGSFIVWLPAGLIMLAIGNIWQGLTILLVGALIIANIDNVLRPPLLGKDTQMHPLLVLFSTLGGIALFNISGFIIGPVISSLFLAVISMYEHYYKRELANN